MRTWHTLALAGILGALPAGASAQKFTGTYTIQGQQGVVTLTLTQQQGGATSGALSGNGTVIRLSGKARHGELTGEAVSGSSRAIFTAAIEGNQLVFGLVELGADGAPNLATSTELRFNKVSNIAAAPPAGATPAAPAPPAAPPAAGRPRAPAATPAPAPPAPRAAAGSAQDQQLRDLLLSSAWCSFSYSQTSGSTSTSRNVFLADGRLLVNTNHEGGTVNQYGGGSTPNGSVYSQAQGGGTYRWQVQGWQLYLDGGEGFQAVPLSIARNSNGYPIITADGKEYSQCR